MLRPTAPAAAHGPGARERITLTCRIDNLDEVDYYRHGGILHYVLRQLLERSAPAGSAD